MPQLTRPWRISAIAAASLALVLASTVAASANETPGQGTGGTHDDQTLDATAFSVTYDPTDPPPGHQLTASSGWTPPACWLAPVATPDGLKTEREKTWALESTGYEWDAAQEDYYVNGHPHTDFERANADKGYWWNGQPNPNRIADPASLTCGKEYDDWVLKGDPPPAGPVITPKMLAESAYDRIRIPDEPVSLSPAALDTQKVNLNTWVWLGGADVKPVSVTARLRSLDIWATTTARPVGLHIDAGTPEADLYPASGDCPRNADGSFGEKYQTGDGNAIPPCGLAYRRSSGNGTYPLKATITWQVSWVGSGGTGANLDDGVFDTTQDVTVGEIEAVNR